MISGMPNSAEKNFESESLRLRFFLSRQVFVGLVNGSDLALRQCVIARPGPASEIIGEKKTDLEIRDHFILRVRPSLSPL